MRGFVNFNGLMTAVNIKVNFLQPGTYEPGNIKFYCENVAPMFITPSLQCHKNQINNLRSAKIMTPLRYRPLDHLRSSR